MLKIKWLLHNQSVCQQTENEMRKEKIKTTTSQYLHMRGRKNKRMASMSAFHFRALGPPYVAGAMAFKRLVSEFPPAVVFYTLICVCMNVCVSQSVCYLVVRPVLDVEHKYFCAHVIIVLPEGKKVFYFMFVRHDLKTTMNSLDFQMPQRVIISKL